MTDDMTYYVSNQTACCTLVLEYSYRSANGSPCLLHICWLTRSLDITLIVLNNIDLSKPISVWACRHQGYRFTRISRYVKQSAVWACPSACICMVRNIWDAWNHFLFVTWSRALKYHALNSIFSSSTPFTAINSFYDRRQWHSLLGRATSTAASAVSWRFIDWGQKWASVKKEGEIFSFIVFLFSGKAFQI